MLQEVITGLGNLITTDISVAFETTLGLIFLDFLLGIIQSIAKGNFNPRRLPQFLQKNILPFVGSIVLLGAFSLFLPEIKIIYFSATAAVGAKFLFDIKDKIINLTGVKLLNVKSSSSDAPKPEEK